MVQNPAAASEQVQVAIGGDASEFNGAIDGAIGQLTSLNAKTLAVAGGGIAALAAALGGLSVDAAADFESAMADVQKVTDEQTADELAGDIRAMSEEINLSSGELAELSAQAGRFGVEGTANMREFTRVAGEMGAATTLSADEAGRSLAKVAEATGSPMENVQQLGDSINELSNNMAVNSQEIVDSAQRSGFALRDMGLSSDEILGVSAAMNEVAPTSRRAAGMMRRMTEAIADPKNVEVFAELLGVTTEEFERMREEEPQELMLEIAESMEENDEAASNLSQELSTAQARAFSRVAGRSEELAEAMQISNDAMEEGGSLSREVAIETDTLSGQFELLKSKINNVFIEIGNYLLPAVKDLVSWFSDAVDVAGDLANEYLPAIESAAGRAADVLGGIGDAIPDFSDPLGTASGDFDSTFADIEETVESAIDNIREILGTTEEAIENQLLDPLADSESEFSETMGELESEARQTTEMIRDIFSRFLSAAIEEFRPVLDNLSRLWETHMTGPDGIVANARSAFNAIWGNIIKPTLDLIQAGWDVFGDDIMRITRGVFGTLETIVSVGMDSVLTTINVILDLISGDWEGANKSLREFTERTFGNIGDWLRNDAKKIISGAIGIIIDQVKEPFEALYDWLFGNSVIKDLINDPAEWLQDSGASIISDAIGSVVDAIKEPFEGVSLSLDWPTPPQWLQDALDEAGGDLDAAIDYLDNLGDGSQPSQPNQPAEPVPPGGGDPQAPNDPDGDDGKRKGDSDGSDSDKGGGGKGSGGKGSDDWDDSANRGHTGLATGGLVEKTGTIVAHAGERVIPEAQVSDRGPADISVDLDMDSLIQEQQRTRDAIGQLANELNVSIEFRDEDRYRAVRR